MKYLTHQEFHDIVNQIADEELAISKHRIEKIMESKDHMDQLVNLLVEAFLQSSDISARVAGKILEKTGVIQFDD